MGEFMEDRDGLIWRRDVIALGYSDDDIKRAVRGGMLSRIWHGAYVRTSRDLSDDALARLRVIAAARSCNHPLVVSHTSAALLHDLPLLKPSHARVHLLNGRIGGGRIESRRHLHAGKAAPGEVIEVDGIALTSLERTAVDTALAGTFDQALVIFDSALRAGADRDVMSAMVESCGPKRGVGPVRTALAAADQLSETVGESWSRAQMLASRDIPRPRLQREFYTSTGVFVARVDFEWEGRLVGEFDGLVKYGQGLMAPGQTPNDVVVAEKIREDRLRQLGLEVVRWTWADLEAGRLPEIIRQAMVRVGLR
jgi:predicted transcriptional regulator of viral defense system